MNCASTSYKFRYSKLRQTNNTFSQIHSILNYNHWIVHRNWRQYQRMITNIPSGVTAAHLRVRTLPCPPIHGIGHQVCKGLKSSRTGSQNISKLAPTSLKCGMPPYHEEPRRLPRTLLAPFRWPYCLNTMTSRWQSGDHTAARPPPDAVKDPRISLAESLLVHQVWLHIHRITIQPKVPTSSIPAPNSPAPYRFFSMNLILELPPSQGYNTINVCIDGFTKMVTSAPRRSKSSMENPQTLASAT